MIRLLIAAATSVFVSTIGTRLLITFLTKNKVGQPIREDGPEGHMVKAGTPTMGGIAILVGAFAGYVAADVANLFGVGTSIIFTRTGLIVMGTILATGIVGFLDDWIKISRERNLGLNKTAKIVGLLTVAILFAVLQLGFTSIHTELSFVRFDSIGIDLGRTHFGVCGRYC